MIRKFTKSFAAPVSISTGATVIDISESVSNEASISAIGTGTYKIMISYDGTSFVQFGSSLTADGRSTLPDAAVKVRVDCSAYTSGTPTVGVGGVLSSE